MRKPPLDPASAFYLMCGRYTLRTPKRLLEDLFGQAIPFEYRARYNIAPTQKVLVFRRNGEGEAGWDELKWGLIPSWAKDQSIAHKLINARAETILEKPSFKQAMRRRRCLVAADGFFEWKAEGRAKQPFLFSLDAAQPFAFAGLWESWIDRQSGAEIRTCTIVTTRAAGVVEEIHERMPVIVPREQFGAWLDTGRNSAEQAQELLLTAPTAPLAASRVSRVVNSPGHDSEQCVKAEVEA